MSKLSTNYPVMQILGYKRIDTEIDALVNDPNELSLYPVQASTPERRTPILM